MNWGIFKSRKASEEDDLGHGHAVVPPRDRPRSSRRRSEDPRRPTLSRQNTDSTSTSTRMAPVVVDAPPTPTDGHSPAFVAGKPILAADAAAGPGEAAAAEELNAESASPLGHGVVPEELKSSPSRTLRPPTSAASLASSTSSATLTPPPSPMSKPVPDSAAATATPLVRGKWFDRIMIINLENTDYRDAIKDPNLASLLTLPFASNASSRLLTNYHALAHPSQPNYLAQIAGHTLVFDDGRHDIASRSIVDLLERRRVSWSSYNEGYPDGLLPGQIFTGEHRGAYVRRHNPFASLTTISGDMKRVTCIKSGEAFEREMKVEGLLPQYVYYTPDNRNNGHDTGIAFAGRWVRDLLVPLFVGGKSRKEAREDGKEGSREVEGNGEVLWGHGGAERTLVVLTFDEAQWWTGRNRVATWLIGDCLDEAALVAGGSKGPREDATKYNHYSILKTVEENWNLGSLKRKDEGATAFRFLAPRVEKVKTVGSEDTLVPSGMERV
ncbi:hypothetical protein HK101_001329 [Irineochytrium annulatum]|nr:hypothetical protein HK101_001329 [Irineochytrium annulatum]